MKITNDTKQRITSFVNFCLEFYKVLMASFLIYFVPTKCITDRNEIYKCSIYDIYYNKNLYNVIIKIFNLITFMFCLCLYYIEIQRENWCIEYLDVDNKLPNNYLNTVIEKYPKFKIQMYKLNNNYYKISYLTIVSILFNFTVSSIYIIQNNYDSDSYITLFTFILLTLNKLYNSYNISLESITTEKAYSSYMNSHTNYNNIDSDYIINDSNKLSNCRIVDLGQVNIVASI